MAKSAPAFATHGRFHSFFEVSQTLKIGKTWPIQYNPQINVN
ncbi:hypothetical protein HMPREF9123_1005 [Neisseria bacilliformis ATCC BAA-1200]|uniref:Uncharacterized protein n=1 Tax=Neisseria bacilliformis ATCC BAA-1200 TaxID=888742 RepID=F2BBA1_9NEIS|nr:hypothetical protein HMPREF9123_1005 [Neisseria bacilliformis ATCC BAA-1200]